MDGKSGQCPIHVRRGVTLGDLTRGECEDVDAVNVDDQVPSILTAFDPLSSEFPCAVEHGDPGAAGWRFLVDTDAHGQLLRASADIQFEA